MKSVLQDWVMDLPLMQQAVLISVIRGPDGFKKEDAMKPVIRFLRGAVLVNAKEPPTDYSELMRSNWPAFMIPVTTSNCYVNLDCMFGYAYREVVDSFDQYPVHFIFHLIHASEIIAYKHPLKEVKYKWLDFYGRLVAELHLSPETEEELDKRLKY